MTLPLWLGAVVVILAAVGGASLVGVSVVGLWCLRESRRARREYLGWEKRR